MASQLFWWFLVLALATETSSWSVRRRSSSCRMINCAVSSWSSWSACSQPCGYGGKRTRTRVVIRQPSCGGSRCPKLLVTRSCNQDKCANGGTPNIGGCNCRQEFSGQCCSQLTTEGKHNRSFVHLFFHPFVRLFPRSFACSFIHLLIRSFHCAQEYTLNIVTAQRLGSITSQRSSLCRWRLHTKGPQPLKLT